jgi:REP element-mobilizing transposase RayT
MQLNGFGQIVAECWRWLPTRFPYVTLDEWVVMPNHLHGLLTLAHDDTRPEGRMAARLDVPLPKPLGRLIGAFKTVSTKRVNAMRARPGQPLWQRDFYERIVRGQEAVVRIRRYILNNPRRWGLDREAGTDVPL